ncbi:MAG: DUF1499 domain-containing protein [Gemmatimonadales bacterium]|nr:MAG: DUF1499 domain-containing protein [Gemmatimonadales bacterium]
MALRRWLRGLTRNRTETRPDHPEPGLRGRRYSVPFQTVWRAALAEAERRLDSVEPDTVAGRITGEARTRLFRFVDDVEIRVALDGEGWTRVDLTSASRVGQGDLGTNRRRILRFLRRLDRRLEADGIQTRPPAP